MANYPKWGACMIFLKYLKGLAEGSAINAVDGTFEMVHLAHVEKHILELAQIRNLDPNIAMAIAYGHDLGRTQGGVTGKGHAKMGESLMRTLLKDSGFSLKEQNVICRAIKRHNKKNLIHKPYDELIKDADSLAHQEECLIHGQVSYEAYRILASSSDKFGFTGASTTKWQVACDICVELLREALLDREGIVRSTDHWVHTTRVSIRKMRSLLWVLKTHPLASDKKWLFQFDLELKQLSQLIANSRILHLAVLKIGHQHPMYFELFEKLEASHQIIRDTVNCEQLLTLLDESAVKLSQIDFDNQKLSKGIAALMKKYAKQAKKVTVKDSEALHQLRLSGKKIKYLSQLGILEIEPDVLYKTIVNVNMLIGKHNDLIEIQTLLGAESFKGELKSLKKIIGPELFLIRKISL